MPLETTKCEPIRSLGEPLQVVCPRCAIETNHEIRAGIECEHEYVDGTFSMFAWDTYQIVRCNGCGTHSFRTVHRNTEESDHDPDTGEEELREKVELYPSRLEGRHSLRDSHFLPFDIERIYKETLSALSGEMPVLAGIGIRALVEAICKERNALGSNLEKRIDGLVAQHVLTADGAEFLHSLRLMGNQAAHEVKPHTLRDLELAMDVVEYVLEGVYLLPRRISHLPQRKPKQDSAPPF